VDKVKAGRHERILVRWKQQGGPLVCNGNAIDVLYFIHSHSCSESLASVIRLDQLMPGVDQNAK